MTSAMNVKTTATVLMASSIHKRGGIHVGGEGSM